MRRLRAVAAVVVAALAVAGGAALHADEAGLYDWARPGVGHAKLAVFHPPSKTLKSVHVASKSNVLASFSTQRGTMRWRHVLGKDDSITCVAASETAVYAGTDSGQLLVVDAANGRVVRNYPVDGRVIGCAVVGEKVRVIVSDDSASHLVTLGTGAPSSLPASLTTKQVTKLPLAAARTAAIVADGDATMVAVTANSEGALSAVALGAADGKPVGSVSTSDAFASTAKRGSFTFTCGGGLAAVLHTCGGAASVSLKKTGSGDAVKFDFTVSDLATSEVPLVCPMAQFAGSDGIPSATVSDTGFLEFDGQLTGLRERVGSAIKLLASRSTAAGKFEALVASSNGDTQLLRLAKGEESGKYEVQPTSWTDFGGLGDIKTGIFPKTRSDLVAAGSMTKDEHRQAKFGLNDRVVLVSRWGALFSLRTGSGGNTTEWTAFPTGDATIHYEGARRRCYEIVSLSDSDDVVIVRMSFGTLVVQLTYDVYTGRLVSHAKASDAGVLAFLPDGEIVTSALAVDGAASENRRAFHRVDKKKGEIIGYAVAPGAATAVEAWRVALGAPMVAFAAGSEDLRAVSSVEHMRFIPNATSGAKDIRRKYPTANLLVTAHYVLDDDDMNALIVTAVDSVTGQVVATMRHNDVEGDVNLVVAEHVVLYHFLKLETMQYVVAAWELFEHQDTPMQDSQTTSPALVVMSFMEKRRKFGAASTRPPMITSQLLAFPHGAVASMGVTVTQQGIARKQIVFVLSEGSVLTVPLAIMLAGGIPETAPSGQKAPPKATVLVPATSFVSHRHRAMHVRRLLSAPTPLESTSHVLAVGLDLFYTRASSGKPFDMVDEEFNRSALVIGCVVLPVAIVVARFFAQRRNLAVAWS